MTTVIVPLKYGHSLATTKDGYILFEVDKRLWVDVKRHVGVHELYDKTLTEVRELVEGKKNES
jgi:hypothetical protein